MFANRIRILRLFILAALAVVWGRIAYLQLALGPWHRATYADGEVRTRLIPAPRGTIRAADGTELARDRCDADLAVHYRYLERPIDEQWLDRQARASLTRRERRDPARVEQARSELKTEIESMWRGLAELTDTPEPELDRRAAAVQRRVERIVESVNRRRRERWEEEQRNAEGGRRKAESDQAREPMETDSVLRSPHSAFRRFCEWLADEPEQVARGPTSVSVVEQNRYFTLMENISSGVLLGFTNNPEQFAGVRLEQRIRRDYPLRELAGAVVGYVEPIRDGEEPNDETTLNSGHGVSGVEGYYDIQLRGDPGIVREQTFGGSHVPRVLGGRAPHPGPDIALTLDLRLQRLAEESLERALEEVLGPHHTTSRATSGAMVVLDVRTGAVVVAASVPRFDLNVASQPASDAAQELAARADSPLFNRVVQMTLPPGSTFKPVTALAAIKSGVDPRESYFCRGFLHEPDKFRCLVYRNFGIGHETVTMTDALVRSCNVYFFQLAERVRGAEIERWGQSLGFGQRSGIDLAGEEPGSLLEMSGPARRGRLSDGEVKSLAIGQGSVQATPVQIAVMMAAIANGGLRVVPHVRRDAFQPPRRIDDIDADADRSLAVVRHALRQVVADAHGTGHEHVFLREIAIAGKTGTAQSGSPRGDHAWFAGYVPAQNPRYAIAVVLEHAGSGGHAAGPIARELVRRMHELGYFNDAELSAALEAATPDASRR
jgi:penicillin-binding protein 2